MSKPTITRGEYHALVEIWRYSPTVKEKGIQWRTLNNLIEHGYIDSEMSYGNMRYWLSDAGKEVMDNHVKVYGAVQ